MAVVDQTLKERVNALHTISDDDDPVTRITLFLSWVWLSIPPPLVEKYRRSFILDR